MDCFKWLDLKEKFMVVMKIKLCDEWCEIMEGIDICFVFVLLMVEVLIYKYNVDRKIFEIIDGVV